MNRVLVLDARERSALATTRALGEAGVDIVTGGVHRRTLAGASRYTRASLVYPDPYTEPARFVAELPAMARKAGVSVILPMTEVTTYLLAFHAESFGDFRIPLAAFPSFDALSNKYRLFELAREAGIPMPQTTFIDSPDQARELAAGLIYPIVVKPFRSRILLGDRWLATSVTVARSADELTQRLDGDEALDHPFLLQEFVEGVGAGLFTHYEHGEPVAFFSHRRLRERPPEGGVSVLSESTPVSDDLKRISRRLLDQANWHGPAMVEFKIGTDGTPYLMEINPRFWGSLQLAVDSGVNFPLIFYRSALGETIEPVDGYRTGQRLRWLLGDLDNLYLTLRKGDRAGSERLRAALRFCNPGFGRVRYEVNRLGDMGPFWHELKRYVSGG